MKNLAFITALVILGACSTVTSKLDEKTGTTLAERCALDYIPALAAAKVAAQQLGATPDRQARIEFYDALVTAHCTAAATKPAE